MLFALADYIQYRRRNGVYGDDPEQNLMALGFLGSIPEDIIAQLEDGDAILTQRLDSILSWGTMYFGSSPVDHIAVYVVDRRVLHMTLAGSRVHPLSVFGQKTRLLPARLNYERLPKADPNRNRNERPPGGSVNRKSRPSHVLPAKWQLAWVGMRILFGFHPDLFRWKFFADIFICCVLLDTIVYCAADAIVFSWLAGIVLCLTTYNLAMYNVRRHLGWQHDLTSHPDMFIRLIEDFGATLFSRFGIIKTFGWRFPLAASQQQKEPPERPQEQAPES